MQTTTFLQVMSPGSDQPEGKGKGEMEPTGKTSEEGRIPELTEDGRNWKIYCAKFLKVTATERLLSIVAGWESDDGSKDWALSRTKHVWYSEHGMYC